MDVVRVAQRYSHARFAMPHTNAQGWINKENFIFGARKFDDIPEGTMACHICA